MKEIYVIFNDRKTTKEGYTTIKKQQNNLAGWGKERIDENVGQIGITMVKKLFNNIT